MFCGLYILYLPVYWCDAACSEEFVAALKVITPEKASICGKGAWVRRLEYQVLRVIQHGLLTSGEAAPKHEYYRSVFFVYLADHGVGKVLSALSLMGSCCVGTDGEDCI